IFLSHQSATAEQSDAHLPSAPLTPTTPNPKNKKIRTHPHLHGTRGKALSRIRVPKKLNPIPKK
ncbi:MAG: hypothetical protein K2M56_00005, partial [Muribaculaceae bacterium]|nr:hypothetical protein [Muribaculaceae bacterium]